MNFDLGLGAVVISIGIFYLRLIQLRGRRKQERRAEELEKMRAPKKKKPGEAPETGLKERPMFQVASWWLVGGGSILMLAGLGLRTSPGILPIAEPYWWVVMVIGVLVFTFSLK
jgi:hypothetical protein